MYKVYMDNKLLYYPGDEEYCITEPTINLALNDAGTFEFGLPVVNPLYGQISNRKSMIRIEKNGNEVFYGEVRESEKDINNARQVYCVGELAFLFDSIQPQKKYQNYTIRQFLESLINEHNSQVEERKRFEIGIVTVTDSNDNIYRFTNRETTLDAIRDKLCDRLNGYLKIRKENDKRYLDFLTLDVYGKKCRQAIEFGANLLEYAENISASDIATAVIPLGVKLDESPIEGLEAYTTIESVNDGKDFLYIPEAVERFGWVRVVQNFDDVTTPSILKSKGLEWLKSVQYENVVLNVKAVDLSIADDMVDQIDLGDKVHALAAPFGMDTWFPVQKLSIPLQSPENQAIELGNTSSKSYTQQASDAGKHQLETIKQVQTDMESAIDNATQMILGSKGGYKISEYDENKLWVRDLYMDAPNKDDAVNILQITNTGMGFSRNGYDGPYKTAWTIDGSFVADYITAGSLNADLIKTGTITAANGKGKININTGVIDFRTSYNNGLTGKFSLSPSGLHFTTAEGSDMGYFYPVATAARTYLMAHRITIGHADKWLEAYYDSTNGAPNGDVVFTGNAIDTLRLDAFDTIVLSNGAGSISCRNSKMIISPPVKLSGITLGAGDDIQWGEDTASIKTTINMDSSGMINFSRGIKVPALYVNGTGYARTKITTGSGSTIYVLANGNA